MAAVQFANVMIVEAITEGDDLQDGSNSKP